MTFCLKKTLLLLCFVILFPNISVASDYQAQKEALNIIGDFADRICNKVSSIGDMNELEISGAAKAELPGFLKKITDLGIEGAAKYKKAEYNNVLQEDLAALLKENSECKQDVVSTLIEKFFPNIIVPNEENKLTKSEAIKKAEEKVSKWLSAYRKEDIGQLVFLSDFPFCLKRDLFENGSELAKTYRENFFNKEDKERREKAIENTHFYIDSVVQGEIREARSKGWNLSPCNLNLNTDDIFITVRVKEKPNQGGTFIFRKEKDHLKMVSCDFW